MAAVFAGWLVGRLLFRTEAITARLILLAVCTALAVFLLAPMLG